MKTLFLLLPVLIAGYDFILIWQKFLSSLITTKVTTHQGFNYNH